MLRDIIIQRFIDDKVIKSIGHDFSVHTKGLIGIMIKLAILYGLRIVLQAYIPSGYVTIGQVFVGIIGLVLMVKYIVDFLNLYLDALVFTKRGVKLFTRESFLKHKMDEFEREHIQVVSSEQNTVWDRLFNRGDMQFALTNNFEFPFMKINNPQKTARTIYMYKDKFLSQQGYQEIQEKTEQDQEKYHMLVETLGEVIKEYIDKK